MLPVSVNDVRSSAGDVNVRCVGEKCKRVSFTYLSDVPIIIIDDDDDDAGPFSQEVVPAKASSMSRQPVHVFCCTQ